MILLLMMVGEGLSISSIQVCISLSCSIKWWSPWVSKHRFSGELLPRILVFHPQLALLRKAMQRLEIQPGNLEKPDVGYTSQIKRARAYWTQMHYIVYIRIIVVEYLYHWIRKEHTLFWKEFQENIFLWYFATPYAWCSPCAIRKGNISPTRKMIARLKS